MLSFAVLALAALAPADTVPRPAPAPSDAPAPEVIVHRQPALPVVALRLSLRASDPPGYAGAGHLFQHLLLPGLEDQVGRVGGRVQATRSADAVTYTVVGPAAELPYLARALGGMLRAPAAGTTELLHALQALSEERGAEMETAPSYVRAALRARLFPGQLPAAGTDAGARRLEVARLPDVWAAMYRPERVAVVAVGDVLPEAVMDVFRSTPDAGGGEPLEELADTVRSLAVDTPQATRAWVGRAYAAPRETPPAVVSVAARLLRDGVRRGVRGGSVETEHWWTHEGQAVAIVVAVPEAGLAEARRVVAGAAAGAAARADEARVRAAAAALTRDMLFYARTPERMAELVGEFADRTGDRDAAQAYFDALAAVDPAAVRAFLAGLDEASAASVVVPPQRIRPN
jgi:predicted Zn-dependent peptidase